MFCETAIWLASLVSLRTKHSRRNKLKRGPVASRTSLKWFETFLTQQREAERPVTDVGFLLQSQVGKLKFFAQRCDDWLAKNVHNVYFVMLLQLWFQVQDSCFWGTANSAGARYLLATGSKRFSWLTWLHSVLCAIRFTFETQTYIPVTVGTL